MFIRETIRPVMEALRQAVQAACPMLAEEAADLCIFSLVGQLAQAVQIQSCRRRETVEIDENLPPAMVDLPRVVEHIVSFTAAGFAPAPARRGRLRRKRRMTKYSQHGVGLCC